MYQEKARQMPIELQYPHMLSRKVLIHIPDGYIIKNAKDLVFDISYKENDVITMGFVSKYTLNNNVIELTIDETYRYVNYPIDQINTFVKVINAAADFNKVVLVLEKRNKHLI